LTVEELAGTGTVDVLAHPDLAKVAGEQPSVALNSQLVTRRIRV